ncbi:MAG TPA: insulinase family protein, partial [Xanthomonadales bacterium]|nr:insulinase family protein [Xanthomonadales bacterium]
MPTPESWIFRLRLPLLMLVACLPGWALANLDFSNARVSHLDNGMTLIVLEEHTLPVVSVQMLYRVGARNETAGATGLAHFLEHMAFRDSENFPDTGLVSAIYAVGGEWHGYTWLDQTTYYATAPREQLDLFLRIEADRMARLQISEEDVIVERGAVLTEMHSYENDPMSVLHDNAMYLT